MRDGVGGVDKIFDTMIRPGPGVKKYQELPKDNQKSGTFGEKMVSWYKKLVLYSGVAVCGLLTLGLLPLSILGSGFLTAALDSKKAGEDRRAKGFVIAAICVAPWLVGGVMCQAELLKGKKSLSGSDKLYVELAETIKSAFSGYVEIV